MTPEVLQGRCNYCSKTRPRFRLHRLTQAQSICDYCMEWHQNAIEVLGGGVPRGCQVCDRSWDFLRDSTLGEQVRMYVVVKDGIYQVLCPECVKSYLPKRADLFKGTPFGHEKLKIAS
jgi:hypothetical protein